MNTGNRYTLSSHGTAAGASLRKSRPDGKQSFLPKPRQSRQGSFDRLSDVAGKPSWRSSSAEAPRMTLAVSTMGRESSSKIPMGNPTRSRSQQGDVRGTVTPLSNRPSSTYRNTTTPLRTPSGEQSGRSWQTSLERALAFMTVKDRRAITTPTWHRTEYNRAQEILQARDPQLGLIRPLTIARFVDVCSSLLGPLLNENHLNNANYVVKLPHLTRRLLYPGNVSKGWLKTVNTLHTFPNALALIVYLLDMVLYCEKPIDPEVVYKDNDAISVLRREYLWKCWDNYQALADFSALDEEYCENLKEVFGTDDRRIRQLEEIIKEFQTIVNDPVEVAAQEHERRRSEALAGLQAKLTALRGQNAQKASTLAEVHEKRAHNKKAFKNVLEEIEHANAELEQINKEVSQQSMSVEQRAQLLDEIDYSNRVVDSKRELIQEVSKMVQMKETELASWQKHSLDSCVQYNQHLIQLATSHADVAQLAIDESHLMQEGMGEHVDGVLDKLKNTQSSLVEDLREAERNKAADARRLSHQNYELEQLQSKLSEARTVAAREHAALKADREAAREEREAVAKAKLQLQERQVLLKVEDTKKAETEKELQFWTEQDEKWRAKLLEMDEYIKKLSVEVEHRLDVEKKRMADLFISKVDGWKRALKNE